MPTDTQRSTRGPRLAGDERREQILDVTKHIVGEHGLHAVSIDRVAREAGIARALVYQHFSNLPGLLRALLDRENDRATAGITAMLSQALHATGPLEALEAALDGYLRAVQADPVTFRVALVAPEGAPEFIRHRVEQSRAAIVGHLADLIADAFGPSSDEGSPDPELSAWSLSALADQWAHLLLTDPDRFGAGRILAHARWILGQFASP